ncbi:MAG: hypothetical protein RL217_121 [Pseudomonadota bacterium]|jgi:DNA repair protein RecN (Recombination protein N)
MLHHLAIHQFALIEQLELELNQGLSVISGETGAGKSILLDALGLALGERAEAGAVRLGAEQAEVSARFSLNAQAKLWLEQHDLPCTDDELVLRRIVTNEGRSRAYINGRSVGISDLKDLAPHLIEIHSQHAHQRLLQKDSARELLDAFAHAPLLANEVSLLWTEWQQLLRTLTKLKEESSETKAQKQLLSYQVEELRELALGEHEQEELEVEHKRLANADSTLLNSQLALTACLGDEHSEQSIQNLLHQALHQLGHIDDSHAGLNDARDLLQQAQIQVEEAASSLGRYLDQIDINPQRLQQIDTRLSAIFSMARKHQIQPQGLYGHWQEQEQALQALSLSDEDLSALEQQAKLKEQEFFAQAQRLSQARQQAASKMSQEVSGHFDSLALGKARFNVQVSPSSPSRTGTDQVTFMVQTNPGMPEGPLAKVASGGELSRISLAIQVVTAAVSQVASLIFDEVDVGIGGGTAERVGRLLRKLGESSQVLCVTHQPQVAAQAHQHFQVSKISGERATHTQLRKLTDKQREEEIARMLGGVEITQHTLAHAQEMLKMASA